MKPNLPHPTSSTLHAARPAHPATPPAPPPAHPATPLAPQPAHRPPPAAWPAHRPPPAAWPAHRPPPAAWPAHPATPSAPRAGEPPRAKPTMSREERQQRAMHDRAQLVLHEDLAPPVDTTIARGARSEELAAAHLVRAGFRIVERNYKTKLGELDIIARDGETLVFVEVRSRSTADYGMAIEMVSIHKQRKVTRMAWQYIKNRRPSFQIARFDVIGITAGDLVHIRDAFRLG